MAKSVGDFILEADEIISKKTAAVEVKPQTDDIFKLAEELCAPSENVEEFNSVEKIAHAVAIVDTMINLPEIVKAMEFEKKARASGYTGEQIADFFEKKASVKFKSVTELFPGLS